MKVLVTGAAGFIGSHAVEALLARGDSVVGLDSFDDFYDPRLKRANVAAFERDERFRLVLADIEDGTAVAGVVANEAPDAVIHLAARAGVRPSIAEPARYERTNGLGTLNVLEALRRRTPPPALVFASSSSVYGTNSRLPFSEEDPITSPVSPYAATKRANELMIKVFHELHGLSAICLRYFTVYGPRQRPEMAIARFIRSIDAGDPIPLFGDGSSRRDYTFVADAVAGTLAALDLAAASRRFEIVNLGGHRTTSLAELVAAIERVVGKKAVIERLPDQPGDVPATYADVEKARRLLGWEPSVPLETGLARHVEWTRTAARRAAPSRSRNPLPKEASLP